MCRPNGKRFCSNKVATIVAAKYATQKWKRKVRTARKMAQLKTAGKWGRNAGVCIPISILSTPLHPPPPLFFISHKGT